MKRQLSPIVGRTSLRFKSWLPEYANGKKPVVLAGRQLPSQVGAVALEPARALCIGPGEWLIVSHENDAARLRERIVGDLSQYGMAFVDASDELVGIELRGCAARKVLSKGCGLDFHFQRFPAGRCARTRFAQIPLVIDCLDESPHFELYVARSYFQYLHAWLTDAVVEFGDA